MQIFVGDSNGAAVAALSSVLDQKEIKIHEFSSLTALHDGVLESPPDLVLVNAELLQNGNGEVTSLTRIPVIAYTDERELQDRLKLYDLGVSRVEQYDDAFVRRLPSLLRMMMPVVNPANADDGGSVTSGSLHSFSLREVLYNAMMDNKSLSLKVSNGRVGARITTLQGHIVEAEDGASSGEEAVLKALQLAEGTFKIRSHEQRYARSEVGSSVLALLSEAGFQKRRIGRLFEEYGPDVVNPGLRALKAGNGVAPESNAKEVLDLIPANGAISVAEVLLKSPMPSADILDQLEQLFANGYLKAVAMEAVSEVREDVDWTALTNLLFQDDVKQGSLVALGLPTSGRSEFIRTFAGLQREPFKSTHALDFTRLKLEDERSLTLFGISIQEAFLPIMEKIATGMLGCVFLVDDSEPEQFEFANYILKQVTQMFDCPFVIGLTHYHGAGEAAVADFIQKFEVPAGLEVVPLKSHSFDAILDLLGQLKEVELPDEEEDGYV